MQWKTLIPVRSLIDVLCGIADFIQEQTRPKKEMCHWVTPIHQLDDKTEMTNDKTVSRKKVVAGVIKVARKVDHLSVVLSLHRVNNGRDSPLIDTCIRNWPERPLGQLTSSALAKYYCWSRVRVDVHHPSIHPSIDNAGEHERLLLYYRMRY